jgi:endoglucanase
LAIREIDPAHIVFVDGNTYSTDFTIFAEPYENAILACHDYARAGTSFGGPSPGETAGQWRHARGGVPGAHALPARHRHADLLDSYDRHGAGWSIWTSKDVGLQGLAYTEPESANMRRVGDQIAKQARLGIDSGGRRNSLIADEFKGWSPYPWAPAGRPATSCATSCSQLPEYVGRFRGLDDASLEDLARSASRAARACATCSARAWAQQLRIKGEVRFASRCARASVIVRAGGACGCP